MGLIYLIIKQWQFCLPYQVKKSVWNFVRYICTLINICASSQILFLLVAIAKWWNATINFVMSTCPPVRPSVLSQLCSHWTDGLPRNLILHTFFENLSRKFDSLKSDERNGYFTRRSIQIYDNISLNSSQNEMFLTRDVQKIETHFMFNFFPPKIVSFMRKCAQIRYNRRCHRRQYKTVQEICDLRAR